LRKAAAAAAAAEAAVRVNVANAVKHPANIV
jgi:hypothetical protein